jgi:hypothetical protein
MNCKPGDLAIVVRPRTDEYLGMMVEILYAQPRHRFQLPDGQWHRGSSEAGEGYEFSWVFRILGQQRRVEMINGGWRMASYGSGRDAALKPLPGLKQDEKTEETSHA